MPSLCRHDASTDLETLWESRPGAAARIMALLAELEGDEDLLDRLTQHGYSVRGHANFNVSKWLEQGPRSLATEDLGFGRQGPEISRHLRLYPSYTVLPCIGDSATGC